MQHFGLKFLLLWALLANGSVLYAGPQDHNHPNRRFEFALIGDLPYNAAQEQQFIQLMNELNQAKLSFVIFDGDFKKRQYGM